MYPDVYELGTNTADNLRAELQSVGIDSPRLDDQTLKQMFARVNLNEEFRVNIADLGAGNALIAGTNQPLTSHSVVAKKPQPSIKPRAGRRGRR
jgi:hypothetical protein